MNPVLEFGKRYGKWIAAGVAATAAVVAGVLIYRSVDVEDDEDYVVVETEVVDVTDE